MALFLFRAEHVKTGAAVKVEVSLGGVARGFTPEQKDKHLTVRTEQSGTYKWVAKKNGSKIAEGKSSGGEIVVPYGM